MALLHGGSEVCLGTETIKPCVVRETELQKSQEGRRLSREGSRKEGAFEQECFVLFCFFQ